MENMDEINQLRRKYGISPEEWVPLMEKYGQEYVELLMIIDTELSDLAECGDDQGLKALICLIQGILWRVQQRPVVTIQ